MIVAFVHLVYQAKKEIWAIQARDLIDSVIKECTSHAHMLNFDCFRLKIGRSGMVGPQGIRGRTGMRGLKGAQGRVGLQGFKGFQGKCSMILVAGDWKNSLKTKFI